MRVGMCNTSDYLQNSFRQVRQYGVGGWTIRKRLVKCSIRMSS